MSQYLMSREGHLGAEGGALQHLPQVPRFLNWVFGRALVERQELPLPPYRQRTLLPSPGSRRWVVLCFEFMTEGTTRPTSSGLKSVTARYTV